MARIKICKEPDCHNSATTAGYCRLHYLKNWKKIKDAHKQKAAKKLNSYIENIVKKHPERYMEIIKRDIRNPRFDKFIQESFGYEDEEIEDLFNEPTYDEEVEKLIHELKLEKNYNK